MKWPISIVIVVVLSFAAHGQKKELLAKAESAYDHKQYKEAIAAYEQLLAEGYKSWILHYNLGNAYYRNDQLGKAIWHFELARKLNPDDEDVRINLGIVSAKTIDKIDSRENFFISAVKTNILSTFTTRTWAWLSIAFAFAASALFLLFSFSSTPTFKRLFFGSAVACTFLLLGSYLLGYSALSSKYDNKFAVILSREVKVMNEPTPVASAKFTLHEGTRIRVVEGNGDWLLIKLENGNEGWAHAADLGII
jgi:tetratricopeptide (TPR) repeat protein